MKKAQNLPVWTTALFLACTTIWGQDKFEFEYRESTVYNAQPQSVVLVARDNGQEITFSESYTDTAGNPTAAVNAGTYNYSVVFNHTFLKDLNGTFTITKSPLTVVANAKSREYGTSNPVFDHTVSGFQGTDTASVISGSPVLSTSADVASGVGGYAISVDTSSMSAGNYTFTSVGSTMSLTRAPLTIQANNASRSYGEPDPAFSYASSGFRNADTAVAVLSGEPSYSTTATSVSTSGSFPISVSQGTLSAANYSLSFVDGTLAIGKLAQSLTGLPASLQLTFGDVDASLPSTSSAGLPVSYSLAPGSGSGVISVSGNTLTAGAVGSVTLVAIQAGNDVYHPAPDAYITVTVGRATFDMSAYPRFNNVLLAKGETFTISDYLVRQTSIPVIITPVFGVTEGIVTNNGDGTLTMWQEGPIVFLVQYDDPEGNYEPSQTYRVLEILTEGVGAPPADDPGTPTTPPAAIPDPINSGLAVGNGWYFLDWFGYYYWDGSSNWIYHTDHGWLWAHSLSSLPVWFYSPSTTDAGQTLGWLYTQDNDAYVYPYFYWHGTASDVKNSRIWYNRILDNGQTVFFSYSNYDWFTVTKN